jgi:hypothetical protein
VHSFRVAAQIRLFVELSAADFALEHHPPREMRAELLVLLCSDTRDFDVKLLEAWSASASRRGGGGVWLEAGFDGPPFQSESCSGWSQSLYATVGAHSAEQLVNFVNRLTNSSHPSFHVGGETASELLVLATEKEPQDSGFALVAAALAVSLVIVVACVVELARFGKGPKDAKKLVESPV